MPTILFAVSNAEATRAATCTDKAAGGCQRQYSTRYGCRARAARPVRVLNLQGNLKIEPARAWPPEGGGGDDDDDSGDGDDGGDDDEDEDDNEDDNEDGDAGGGDDDEDDDDECDDE